MGGSLRAASGGQRFCEPEPAHGRWRDFHRAPGPPPTRAALRLGAPRVPKGCASPTLFISTPGDEIRARSHKGGCPQGFLPLLRPSFRRSSQWWCTNVAAAARYLRGAGRTKTEQGERWMGPAASQKGPPPRQQGKGWGTVEPGFYFEPRGGGEKMTTGPRDAHSVESTTDSLVDQSAGGHRAPSPELVTAAVVGGA